MTAAKNLFITFSHSSRVVEIALLTVVPEPAPGRSFTPSTLRLNLSPKSQSVLEQRRCHRAMINKTYAVAVGYRSDSSMSAGVVPCSLAVRGPTFCPPAGYGSLTHRMFPARGV